MCEWRIGIIRWRHEVEELSNWFVMRWLWCKSSCFPSFSPPPHPHFSSESISLGNPWRVATGVYCCELYVSQASLSESWAAWWLLGLAWTCLAICPQVNGGGCRWGSGCWGCLIYYQLSLPHPLQQMPQCFSWRQDLSRHLFNIYASWVDQCLCSWWIHCLVWMTNNNNKILNVFTQK